VTDLVKTFKVRDKIGNIGLAVMIGIVHKVVE
jgi:hypothetical protein